MRHRAGVSFIELLMVITIVATITGAGSMYYREMMDRGNEERVRIDLRTIKKAIFQLENDQKVTIRPDQPHYDAVRCATLALAPPNCPPSGMEPLDLGVNEGGFTLDKLLDFRLLTRLPRDPWGSEYEIDIVEGRLFSIGEDMEFGTADDIRVEFRPPFQMIRAHVTDDRRGIEVEFNRKVDPFSVFADVPGNLPFELSIDGGAPAAPSTMTTATRISTNPFGVLVRLSSPLPPVPPSPGHGIVSVVSPGGYQVRAMDSAVVTNLNVNEPVSEF